MTRLDDDFWSVNEDDEKVGPLQLIAALLTLVFVVGVIIGGGFLVAAWANALP